MGKQRLVIFPREYNLLVRQGLIESRYLINCEIDEEKNALVERIAQQEEIIKELKNILLDAGAKTHKSKMLYDWYCENAGKESEGGSGDC